MKEYPLIMTPENGEKIYRGVKTQTRRLDIKKYMRFKNGQRFWIREAWCCGKPALPSGSGIIPWYGPQKTIDRIICTKVVYRGAWGEYDQPKWRSGMFMYRWACRSVVELVEDPRVERLQEITEEDAVAEGCASYGSFRELWQSINGNSSWDLNPEVVRLAFRKVGTS